ncbi:hypothetical protein [Vibrio splendidus]|uniref:hypothetical protein n=1 Tax=Vibrio splendidus TaxID=29497 RepID=UPI000769E1C1|nr:hypothetical protein [Vibrio splendidus]PHX03479.1 hypothetical protein VSPL_50930 [Vibrio splendidus]
MEIQSKHNDDAIQLLERRLQDDMIAFSEEYSCFTKGIVDMYIYARDFLRMNLGDEVLRGYADSVFYSCVRFVRSLYLDESARKIQFSDQQYPQTLFPDEQYNAAKRNYELLIEKYEEFTG